jgi:hypothetical protein
VPDEQIVGEPAGDLGQVLAEWRELVGAAYRSPRALQLREGVGVTKGTRPELVEEQNAAWRRRGCPWSSWYSAYSSSSTGGPNRPLARHCSCSSRGSIGG